MQRTDFVKKYLRVSDDLTDDADDVDRRAVRRFVDQSLRPDGVFTLRMISVNAGDLISTELVHCLWQNFKAKLPKSYIDPKKEPLLLKNTKPEIPEHGFVETFYKVPVIEEEKS